QQRNLSSSSIDRGVGRLHARSRRVRWSRRSTSARVTLSTGRKLHKRFRRRDQERQKINSDRSLPVIVPRHHLLEHNVNPYPKRGWSKLDVRGRLRVRKREVCSSVPAIPAVDAGCCCIPQ